MPGFFSRIKQLLTGKPSTPASPPAVPREQGMRARIDSAQTTSENSRHWAQADALSADAAYDSSVRYKLRNRARYEVLNNCYAKASVRSAADDLIGTGPRLQLTIPGDETGEAARQIERSYAKWCDATQYAMQLRTAQKSRVRDGEAFGILTTNPRQAHPVQLYVRWVEAEMCCTPFSVSIDPRLTDGIRFDDNGLPVEYYFLKYHPGGSTFGFQPFETYTVPADRVAHWFCLERFGQHRAIPEITPALPLYSQVRRYTLATLTAAEFAAMLAGIMKTNANPETGVTAVPDWTMFEMARGALLTLPEGWEATQFRSENPTSSYKEFKQELLNESGRSTNQPLNVVTGNSSGYNYSSGRLDHLPYQRGLRIERNDLRLIVLDPIFRAWLAEAIMVGVVPSNLPPMEEWAWTWNWDGFDQIDPNKDAAADETRLANGTQTYAETYSAYGQDWQAEFEQIAREKAYCEKLGLPWPMGKPAPAAPAPADPNKPAPETPEDAVSHALAEAGVPETKAQEILEGLAPIFTRLKATGFQFSRNGHKNGAVK